MASSLIHLDNLNSDDHNNNDNFQLFKPFPCKTTRRTNVCTTSTVLYYPMVFRIDYDIQVGFLECLHPFDMCKWGKVAQFINESFNGNIGYLEPNNPISDEQLSLVHSEQFLRNLRSRRVLVMTSEICLLYFVPLSWTNRKILQPLRYQTSGTILAASLALKHQAAINLGGGFHHCSAHRSGGFCFFADITLAIRNIWLTCIENNKPKSSILIVDCDAHQGNGYARDILKMSSEEKKLIYIMDMFNPNIYPRDEIAKKAINREIHLGRGIQDRDYLKLLDYHLKAIVDIDQFKPDFIIYNAGTDILEGDRLGQLNISPSGILKRDEMLFQFGTMINASILMLLSGGYQRNNARVIANSIINLINLNLISPINNGGPTSS